MKSLTLAVALALAGVFSQSNDVLAKGPGHGGGHSGGGHSGGGHAGGHSSGGHAGGSHAGGASHRAAAQRSGGSATTRTSQARARPRDGHAIVGTAVPRTMTVSPIAVTAFGVLPSSRWPYFSSAFGIGAFGSYRDPLGSQYYGYAGYPAYAQDPFDAAGPTGGLRLKVEPSNAEVLVDGYFAGIVNDFNGHFQQLKLTAGPHRVEVRAPGYEPLVFDVSIQPRHTTEYRGTLPR